MASLIIHSHSSVLKSMEASYFVKTCHFTVDNNLHIPIPSNTLNPLGKKKDLAKDDYAQ